MKPRVYLETSIIGYLTSWPSRDLVTAAHQQVTRDWWRDRRGEYELYVSVVVIRECEAGDPIAVAERNEVLRDLSSLVLTPKALALSRDSLAKVPLPAKANVDALHIAVATAGGMDYLLTWNCRHIANAELRLSIESVCIDHGFDPLIICTPEELEEEHSMVHDPILNEIRKIREAYAGQFGFDQQAIYDDLKSMEQGLIGRLVQLPPRRIDPTDPRVDRRKRTA